MNWLNLDAITAFLLRNTPTFFEWAMIFLPLTIYLLWLGFEVGRKKQPYYLSGTNDALLLFLGLSGFLFLGPPTWVIARFAVAGESRYFLVYGIYVAIVVLLAWRWIRSRRRSLVIYNIDPNVFEATARPIFNNLGVPYQMTPGHVAFANQQLLLDLEPTPSLYCVTVAWTGDAQLWQKLEGNLRTALADVSTERNPAGAIIPLYASLLLCYTSMCTVLFVWYYAFMF